MRSQATYALENSSSDCLMMVSFTPVDVETSWVTLLMNVKIKSVTIVIKLDMSLKTVKKNFCAAFVNVVHTLLVIVIFRGTHLLLTLRIFSMALTNDNLLMLILRLFRMTLTHLVSNLLLMTAPLT